jgi:hypothetical protein
VYGQLQYSTDRIIPKGAGQRGLKSGIWEIRPPLFGILKLSSAPCQIFQIFVNYMVIYTNAWQALHGGLA